GFAPLGHHARPLQQPFHPAVADLYLVLFPQLLVKVPHVQIEILFPIQPQNFLHHRQWHFLGRRLAPTPVEQGTPFRDRQMIVALGINSDGRKTVLGLREGAAENATVVSELLGDLASRGLDFSVPRLYVLDWSKALAAAPPPRHSEGSVLPRKKDPRLRNAFLEKSHHTAAAVRKKLQNAYALDLTDL